MAMKRQVRSGQVCSSSSNEVRPVTRSGHDSYAAAFVGSSAEGLCIRGFSKATLRRSIDSDCGSMPCARRASSVQSRPPENRIASLVGGVALSIDADEDGGSGMFSILGVSEPRNSCSRCSTLLDVCVMWDGLGGICSFREREGITYLTMSSRRSPDGRTKPTDTFGLPSDTVAIRYGRL